MSARSRAYRDLAEHFRYLRDRPYLDPEAPPLYNAWEMWDRAADMAAASAEEYRWRERLTPGRLRVSIRKPWRKVKR